MFFSEIWKLIRKNVPAEQVQNGGEGARGDVLWGVKDKQRSEMSGNFVQANIFSGYFSFNKS